jgi:metal-responsive CopG/Arc/MetJ family transcriptional regulator
MASAVKIAISLPSDVLHAAENERRARGQTRSEFIRHAIEAYLREAREREAVARYVQAYRDQPETEEETAAFDALAIEAFGSEPWE